MPDVIEVITQETTLVVETTESQVLEVATGIKGDPGEPGQDGASSIEDVPGLQEALDGKQPAGDYVEEGDARLSDARPPTAHTQAASTITDFQAAVLAYLQTLNVGGVLSGDLLAPGFGQNMVYQSELDALLGAALGIATLGADSKLAGSQIPQALLGATRFMGFWDASTNETIPDLGPLGDATEENKGQYWIVAVAGNTELDAMSSWALGDWAISLGSQWGKVDNTDAVISVAGKTGIVTLAIADIGGLQAALDLKANASAVSNVDNTSDLNKPISTATQAALDAKQNRVLLNALWDPCFVRVPTSFNASGSPTYSEANALSWWVTRITGSGNVLTIQPASGGALPSSIRSCLRIEQPTGSDTYFSQMVVNRRGALWWASDRTLYLTLYARVTSGSCTLAPTVRQFFGTGGSTLVDVSPTPQALTADWVRYTFEFAMPTVVGKTIGGTDHALQMYCFLGTGAKTVEITGIMLSEGTGGFSEVRKDWGRF